MTDATNAGLTGASKGMLQEHVGDHIFGVNPQTATLKPKTAVDFIITGKCDSEGSGKRVILGESDSHEQCRQLCDADSTCVGYETGTASANKDLGFSCCLEFCQPPGGDLTPFLADAATCSCWTLSNGDGIDAAAREQWTYHLKGGLASDSESASGGFGDGSCSAQSCNSYHSDCCAPPGDIQSCRTPGLYPVSIGTCDSWYGLYTCCPESFLTSRDTRPYRSLCRYLSQTCVT